MNKVDPKISVLRALEEAGFRVSSPLEPMAGGRTNLVFRSGDLVVKLYRPEQANPMFGNSVRDELAALRALQGSGIAPEPLGLFDSELGQILAYRHVRGLPWRDGTTPVAELLGRLHSQPVPDLPSADSSPLGIIVTGKRLISDVTAFPDCPPIPDLPPSKPAFIHGDITANNIIVDGSTLTLIDWQCPRIGDSAEDLAGFLSPAMQVMFGPGLLSADQVKSFLSAYPDLSVVTRYRALAPLFHWRMAAYCQWQVKRGLGEYQAGLKVEIAAMTAYQKLVTA